MPTLDMIDRLETEVCTYSFLVHKWSEKNLPTAKASAWIAFILREAGFDVTAEDLLAEMNENPIETFMLMGELNAALTPDAPEVRGTKPLPSGKKPKASKTKGRS